MEIEIEDNKKWLTKNQRQKIKNLYKQGVDKQEILEKIHYENENQKYKDYQEEKINENKIKLKFTDISQRDLLLHRLQYKLKNKETLRNNNYKDDAWKEYYQILNHPLIKSIPEDTIKKGIPNPDEIRKQADTFRIVNKSNPNPLIKNYIDTCLNTM